ncbi:hypothetical protein ID866_11423, partial [Astraeus odoratus]
WINNTDPTVPRIFWLSGLAGQGKSAIAHSIATYFFELGGLGACFCFFRDRQAERLHEKIFVTIARDLADRDHRLKRALVDVIKESLAEDGAVERIVIIIDALDESGEPPSRKDILRLLASEEGARLPANYRILLTSRPLPDITDILQHKPHIKAKSMDEIPPASTEHDLQAYISHQLLTLGSVLHDEDIASLVKLSDGLFEWARLACDFIKMRKIGSTARERFEDLVSSRSKGKNLLDVLYCKILNDIFQGTSGALPRFHSVMRQILWALEPLSMDSLNALREGFPCEADRYDIGIVLESMGSLLSGISKRSALVRALHSSFHDFLTDASRSGEFYIEKANIDVDMAFASFHIMWQDLRFNICNLETSYLPNSDIVDLDQRIRDNISHHLSYSCRFWGIHLHEAEFDGALAMEVKAFFTCPRVLFWLEVLSLINGFSNAVPALKACVSWLKRHDQGVPTTARDAIKFVQTFGTIILHSTPHLYLSALPFTPTTSALHILISPNFPRISQVESRIGNVIFSQDGKKIVSTSYRSTNLWDVESGLKIDSYLSPTRLSSVAYSPDGTRIAV